MERQAHRRLSAYRDAKFAGRNTAAANPFPAEQRGQ
jgi:hypothetical protein